MRVRLRLRVSVRVKVQVGVRVAAPAWPARGCSRIASPLIRRVGLGMRRAGFGFGFG